tara:strand:- start:22638 stop:24644 length:2007 start_codon:yes stop_codon:yes gene_type:complete
MTSHNPSLFVRRFVISAGEHRGYDETFKLGLNFITGESNAVGKSTVVNLLAFALGSDLTDWTPETLRFDSTLVEVSLNGATLTLRREISEDRGRPMDVYWGSLDDALKATITDWERYGYKRSDHKESFSSLLFKLLGLPEIHNELGGKLTMHQILRLIFVDQLTPSDEMFGSEDFDSPAVKREVGAILCGYYSDAEYRLRADLRTAADELQELKARQKILDEFVLDTEQDISVLSVQTQLDNARFKLTEAEASVRTVLENPRSRREITTEYKRQLKAAQKDVENAAHDLGRSERELVSTRFAIEDSQLFVDSLDRTLAALEQSASIRDALGELPIRSCPVCHHPVALVADESNCPLCKETRSPGADETQLLRMRSELTLQREESLRLQDERQEQMLRLEVVVPQQKVALKTTRMKLGRLQESIDPAIDATIGTAYREAGYLQGVVEDLERQLRMVQELEAARERRSRLDAEINRMKSELAAAEDKTEERRSEARRLISEHTVELLRRDECNAQGEPVERGLSECHSVDFSFSKGQVRVDGRRTFSASSMVILKNSFHTAMLLASLDDPDFRYPRLLILDNIEDKGMQPSRSHNFQHLLLDVSKNTEVDHQIIATTSMIAEDLRGSEHIVGQYYTSTRKSLVLPSHTSADGEGITTSKPAAEPNEPDAD